MEKINRFPHIPGWGADLDEANRPAYPKERLPARPIGVHWDQPEQQETDVEILCSSERDGITPIFGTTVPPSGVSGAVRRLAFKFSENDVRHWMLLLFADRTNMLEGVFDDLGHGHVPNLWKEMGLAAAWKHDRPAIIRKAAIAGAVVAAAVLLARRRRR
jgi:hypothetical protein